MRPAATGGLSKVASAVAVHNAILERRPDLHALLCEPYYHSRQGEAGGELKYYTMPLFAVRDGRFTSQYSRTFVEAAQRIPGVPRMTAAQDEALDLWAEMCEELCYTMDIRPGDIQLLNNHVVYHARTTYEDDPTPGRDRFLMRLWLSMSNSRALPEGYEALWGSIEPGALRGGIAQASGRTRMNRKRVGILVFPDVGVLDFCGPFEVFSVTRLDEERRREDTVVSAGVRPRRQQQMNFFNITAESEELAWPAASSGRPAFSQTIKTPIFIALVLPSLSFSPVKI